MSGEMNKQIEELTNELVFTSNYGTYNAVADYLYNKGYRKSTDVAREIFEKLAQKRNEYWNKGKYTMFECWCNAEKDVQKEYESEGVE